MNAMNSTSMTLQTCEAAAPVVAAMPAVTPAPAGESGTAAMPGLFAGALPLGFAQALAAELPAHSEAGQALLAVAAEPTDPMLPSTLAFPVPVAASTAESAEPTSEEVPASLPFGVTPLDLNGLATLAAVLLWPAGLPAAGAADAAYLEAIGGDTRGALVDGELALTTQRPAQLPYAPALANTQLSSVPTVALGESADFLEPQVSGGTAGAMQFAVAAASASSDVDVAPADGSAPTLMTEGQGGMNLPLNSQRATPMAVGPAQAVTTSLALKGESHQWQQPLLQALGDRLQLQIAGRSEQAVIRLSPPMLGQVEIAIRQQAGELQVRLSASHAEVTRQLQQVSEGLRHDLVQRHSGEVTVQVSASGRDSDARSGAGRDSPAQQHTEQQERQGQQQPKGEQEQQRRPGRALQEASRGEGRFATDMTLHASSV